MKKIILLSLGITLSIMAHAQKNEREHKGFFLSMGLGPVFGPIHMDSNVEGKYDMTGTGAIFDLKIGAAIKENLILHATLASSIISGPKITQSIGGSMKASNNLSLGEGLLGGGLTYYFTPLNAFVSGSAGLGYFSVDNTDINYSGSTDKGFGFQLKAGKEWWVSKRWGLGIAAIYGKTSVNNRPDNSLQEKLNSDRIGIVFSATLN